MLTPASQTPALSEKQPGDRYHPTLFEAGLTLASNSWQIAGILAGILLAALVWAALLKRRVKAQTETIRRRLEKEAALEQRYRDLFENANDIICTLNLEGKFRALNQAGERVTGYSRQAMLALNIRELLAPEDRKLLRSSLVCLLRDGVLPPVELNLITASGSVVTVEASARLIRKEGKPLGLEAIARDITERKKADRQLRESEERYRTLFESNPYPAWVYDLKTLAFLAVNEAAVRHYGYSQAEFLSMTIKDIRPPEDVARLIEQVERIRPKSDRTSNWRHSKKDGTTIDVEIRSHELIFDGRPARIVLVNDITERRQFERMLQTAKEAAESASRAKSEFLATMSHEIRTPMNGVIGMVGLLLDTELSEEQREYAETIRSSGQALLAILNDILDFSKIEAGRVDLECSDLDLRACVHDATALLADTARRKRLRLIARVAPETPYLVRGDAGRIRQILINLIGNALKFTERGEVTVEVGPIENFLIPVPESGQVAPAQEAGDREPANSQAAGRRCRLRFSVRDTGIGIHPEDRQRLFQSFSQADSSTTRKFGGTGLGLAICKRLVELMGGNIGVESAPGEGSCFWFTLDLAVSELDELVSRPQPGGSQPGPFGEGRRSSEGRALVVEDHAVNQRLIVRQLEKLGLQADVAGNGKEALTALSQRHYDLLLMDCQMPEMDGFETTRLIRQGEQDNSRRQLIVALTANAMEGDRERCLAAGMDGYLAKPVQLEELRRVVDSLLPAAPWPQEPVSRA